MGVMIRIHQTDTFVVDKPLSETLPERRCIMCSEKGGFNCVRCHSAAYCSAECQKKDWKTHKHVCDGFKDFSDTKRPSTDHYRALVFPSGRKVPEWVWIRGKHDTISVQSICEHIGEFENQDDVQMIRLYETLPGKGTGFVAICDWSRNELTRSVCALGEPRYLHRWRGEVLVVGFLSNTVLYREGSKDTAETLPSRLSDLSMRDFRNIIDAFQAHPTNPCVTDPERYPWATQRAVKLNGLSEAGRYEGKEWPAIEQCTVPRLMASNFGQWACAYPWMLGLPWICRMLTPDCLYAPDSVDATLHQNPEARMISSKYLFGHDSQSLAKGKANEKLHVVCAKNPGTVIIMDKYGAPIHMSHIRAVSAFLRYNDETPTYSEDVGLEKQSKHNPTLKKLDREHFEAFWERLKANPGGPWDKTHPLRLNDSTPFAYFYYSSLTKPQDMPLVIEKDWPGPYDRNSDDEPYVEDSIPVWGAEMDLFGKPLGLEYAQDKVV